MKHLVAIILISLSIFKVEMVYSGEPEWLLWGNPANITYDPINHVWSNANTLSENWRWSYSDQRDQLLEPEKVPEKKKVELSVNSFWKPRDDPFELPVVVIAVVTTKKNIVAQTLSSFEEEKWIIDRELRWYRPRETFCPITKALAENDEYNVLGYAGAATDDLLLSMELERREYNRCVRWRRGA
jgi:hypothetical protein